MSFISSDGFVWVLVIYNDGARSSVNIVCKEMMNA